MINREPGAEEREPTGADVPSPDPIGETTDSTSSIRVKKSSSEDEGVTLRRPVVVPQLGRHPRHRRP